ncbi:DUF1330 domain-containing protein [Streptomyces sp. NRRL S-118]|uniref:DUF1330 domain-containing protein n=1 Tax=Streptomyces sp. NRRL S-118 TaxID=1463881 RepID=UPI0004C775F1|nr:DUF1330 domain-containing protein [Streptomyces sp. NRRL S-118]
MSAYIVIDLDIRDAEGFRRYVELVTPLMDQAGARNLVVDEAPVVLEGDWRPSTLVVHEFPDLAAAQAFWDAPEYQPLKSLRRDHSSVRVVVGATGRTPAAKP